MKSRGRAWIPWQVKKERGTERRRGYLRIDAGEDGLERLDGVELHVDAEVGDRGRGGGR